MRKLWLFSLLFALLLFGYFIDHKMTGAAHSSMQSDVSAPIEVAPDEADRLILTLGGGPPPPPKKPTTRAKTQPQTNQNSPQGAGGGNRPRTQKPKSHPPRKNPGQVRSKKVIPGETIEGICAAHYGDALYAHDVRVRNGLKKGVNPKPGLILTLPSKQQMKRRYVVVSGDSLGKIAQKLLGSVRQTEALAQANKIKNPNSLRPGDVLLIPNQ